MKKIFASLLGASLMFSMSSCNDDIEIWDSAVKEYSGTFVYELQSEAGTTIQDYTAGNKIEIYNTAADNENEIIIFDHNSPFDLKSKFFLNGAPSSFSSKSLEFDELTTNEFAIKKPDVAPTAMGTTESVNRDYIKAAILEAKILKDGMTTTGGNIADSIYVKMVLYSGKVNFKSVAVPVEYRTNPDKEEFEWEFVSVEYDNTKDETYILSGHRYTGFSEDEQH